MRPWIVLSSSSGETFQSVWKSLSAVAQKSCAGAFTDRECGSLEVFQKLKIPNTKKSTKEKIENDVLDLLKTIKSEGLILLCGYYKILSENFISKCPWLIINTHPSLLPAFQGLDKKVHEAAIESCSVSGFTVHLVNEKMDDGAILYQHPVFLDARKNKEDLRDDVRVVEQNYLPKVWETLLASKINKAEDSSLTSYSLRRKYPELQVK